METLISFDDLTEDDEVQLQLVVKPKYTSQYIATCWIRIAVGNMTVAGMTTTSLLNVGFGATMVKVQGTPATRVGINSIVPAFTLDVDGDSNVTGTCSSGWNQYCNSASSCRRCNCSRNRFRIITKWQTRSN